MNNTLDSLAQTFAKLKGEEILASRIDGDTIIIVLGGIQGGKYIMAQPELEEAINELSPMAYIEEAVQEVEKERKTANKKGKGK